MTTVLRNVAAGACGHVLVLIFDGGLVRHSSCLLNPLSAVITHIP